MEHLSTVSGHLHVHTLTHTLATDTVSYIFIGIPWLESKYVCVLASNW